MLDMSWGEIMVIGGVALIVIGPKDLPRALRTVGQMTSKVRRMAGEFQSQFNEAMREAELDDVRREVEGLNRSVSSATSTAFNPIQTIRDELKGPIEAPGAGSSATAPSVPPELPAPAAADVPTSAPAGETRHPEAPLDPGLRRDQRADQARTSPALAANPAPATAFPPPAEPSASSPETQPPLPRAGEEPVRPAAAAAPVAGPEPLGHAARDARP